jgi:hypothetical protein
MLLVIFLFFCSETTVASQLSFGSPIFSPTIYLSHLASTQTACSYCGSYPPTSVDLPSSTLHSQYETPFPASGDSASVSTSHKGADSTVAATNSVSSGNQISSILQQTFPILHHYPGAMDSSLYASDYPFPIFTETFVFWEKDIDGAAEGTFVPGNMRGEGRYS